jgi:hypothetical protein
MEVKTEHNEIPAFSPSPLERAGGEEIVDHKNSIIFKTKQP